MLDCKTRPHLIFMFALVLWGISSGCSIQRAFEIDQAIEEYSAKSPAIKLGDSKDKVLSWLQPTQAMLSMHDKKPMEAFTDTSKGVASTIEIYYFRSARIPDNRITDDEFTPYVFKDGTLVAIGWTALGGPKVPPPPPQTNVIVQEEHKFSQPPPKTNFTCFQTGPFMNCQ
ncbi:MAG: hypothetical protein HY348_13250 [Nitrospira defluvii]|nr:hypothetical protein [Nitrospira defluvii]